MKTIRWGIIGCGDVTEVKSGPALQQAENSELVAVMRRNGEKAKDYAERHNVPRWYDDATALINDTDVNAVYIATPPDSHLDYTLAVARAGKPIYVEKPMARSFAECQTMIETCQQAGVSLYVAYYRRELPRFLKIKQMIDSGMLGNIRFVTVMFRQPARTIIPDQLPWRYRPEIAGGGHFVDLGSHMLDILDWMLGPIRTVTGSSSHQGGQYPVEDMVSGAFVFENGVHAVGTWCFTSFDFLDQTEIVGNQGHLAFSMMDDSPLVLHTKDGIQKFDIKNPLHIQQPLIQTVVNDLLGMGQCLSTGETAARSSWVMDQLLADYYTQQQDA